MVNTLRTARLPADMVAVEQDAAAATTEEMIAREQKRQAQLKEIEVTVMIYIRGWFWNDS